MRIVTTANSVTALRLVAVLHARVAAIRVQVRVAMRRTMRVFFVQVIEKCALLTAIVALVVAGTAPAEAIDRANT